jgi:hypothetical protein
MDSQPLSSAWAWVGAIVLINVIAWYLEAPFFLI